MKTYLGLTFVGWVLTACFIFCMACWVQVIEHVIVPAVMAVVG